MPHVAEPNIREAEISDAPEITHVHLSSSKQMLNGIVSAEWLTQMDLTFRKRLKYWEQLLSNRIDDPLVVSVAESQKDGIVGFISVLTKDGNIAELDCLYVLSAYRSMGLGKKLLTQAQQTMKSKGYESLYVFVLEENRRAREFYLSTGARECGDAQEAKFGKESAIEIKLAWDFRSL